MNKHQVIQRLKNRRELALHGHQDQLRSLVRVFDPVKQFVVKATIIDMEATAKAFKEAIELVEEIEIN